MLASSVEGNEKGFHALVMSHVVTGGIGLFEASRAECREDSSGNKIQNVRDAPHVDVQAFKPELLPRDRFFEIIAQASP